MIQPLKRTLPVASLLLALLASTAAQTYKTSDISAVAAAGRISGGSYTNSLLKLTVDAPNATLQANPLVNKEGQRARLVQIGAVRHDMSL